MGKLSIVYLGNHQPDLPAEKRFTTESHIAETLESLGHRVNRVHEQTAELPQILEACRDADLFLWTRTMGFLRCDGYQMLARIRIPTVTVHLDAYIGLEREKTLGFDPFWHARYCWTADGGHDEIFKAKGINHFWFRPGVLKRECYMAEPRVDLITDVAFCGSRGYHREHPRGELIAWLEKTYGTRFRLFGANGDSWRGHNLNQLYASCRVMVGDSCNVGFKQVRYWSDRVPETTGRGGFLIHPFVEGMEDIWTDGEHIRYYRFGEYARLKELIDHYLDPAHESDRRRIQIAGHERTKAVSTYDNRMTELLRTVASYEPAIAERLKE